MDWISAERGGPCDWLMAKKTGNVCPCSWWSFWTRAVTLLVWQSSCHHNRLFSEPPTFGGKQYTFNQMNRLVSGHFGTRTVRHQDTSAPNNWCRSVCSNCSKCHSDEIRKYILREAYKYNHFDVALARRPIGVAYIHLAAAYPDHDEESRNKDWSNSVLQYFISVFCL